MQNDTITSYLTLSPLNENSIDSKRQANWRDNDDVKRNLNEFARLTAKLHQIDSADLARLRHRIATIIAKKQTELSLLPATTQTVTADDADEEHMAEEIAPVAINNSQRQKLEQEITKLKQQQQELEARVCTITSVTELPKEIATLTAEEVTTQHQLQLINRDFVLHSQQRHPYNGFGWLSNASLDQISTTLLPALENNLKIRRQAVNSLNPNRALRGIVWVATHVRFGSARKITASKKAFYEEQLQELNHHEQQLKYLQQALAEEMYNRLINNEVPDTETTLKQHFNEQVKQHGNYYVISIPTSKLFELNTIIKNELNKKINNNYRRYLQQLQQDLPIVTTEKSYDTALKDDAQSIYNNSENEAVAEQYRLYTQGKKQLNEKTPILNADKHEIDLTPKKLKQVLLELNQRAEKKHPIKLWKKKQVKKEAPLRAFVQRMYDAEQKAANNRSGFIKLPIIATNSQNSPAEKFRAALLASNSKIYHESHQVKTSTHTNCIKKIITSSELADGPKTNEFSSFIESYNNACLHFATLQPIELIDSKIPADQKQQIAEKIVTGKKSGDQNQPHLELDDIAANAEIASNEARHIAELEQFIGQELSRTANSITNIMRGQESFANYSDAQKQTELSKYRIHETLLKHAQYHFSTKPHTLTQRLVLRNTSIDGDYGYLMDLLLSEKITKPAEIHTIIQYIDVILDQHLKNNQTKLWDLPFETLFKSSNNEPTGLTTTGRLAALQFIRHIVTGDISHPYFAETTSPEEIKKYENLLALYIPKRRLNNELRKSNATKYLIGLFFRYHLKQLYTNASPANIHAQKANTIKYRELITKYTGDDPTPRGAVLNAASYFSALFAAPDEKYNLHQNNPQKTISWGQNKFPVTMQEVSRQYLFIEENKTITIKIKEYLNGFKGNNTNFSPLILMLGNETQITGWLALRLPFLIKQPQFSLTKEDIDFLQDERTQKIPNLWTTIDNILTLYIEGNQFKWSPQFENFVDQFADRQAIAAGEEPMVRQKCYARHLNELLTAACEDGFNGNDMPRTQPHPKTHPAFKELMDYLDHRAKRPVAPGMPFSPQGKELINANYKRHLAEDYAECDEKWSHAAEAAFNFYDLADEDNLFQLYVNKISHDLTATYAHDFAISEQEQAILDQALANKTYAAIYPSIYEYAEKCETQYRRENNTPADQTNPVTVIGKFAKSLEKVTEKRGHTNNFLQLLLNTLHSYPRFADELVTQINQYTNYLLENQLKDASYVQPITATLELYQRTRTAHRAYSNYYHLLPDTISNINNSHKYDGLTNKLSPLPKKFKLDDKTKTKWNHMIKTVWQAEIRHDHLTITNAINEFNKHCQACEPSAPGAKKLGSETIKIFNEQNNPTFITKLKQRPDLQQKFTDFINDQVITAKLLRNHWEITSTSRLLIDNFASANTQIAFREQCVLELLRRCNKDISVNFLTKGGIPKFDTSLLTARETKKTTQLALANKLTNFLTVYSKYLYLEQLPTSVDAFNEELQAATNNWSEQQKQLLTELPKIWTKNSEYIFQALGSPEALFYLRLQLTKEACEFQDLELAQHLINTVTTSGRPTTAKEQRQQLWPNTNNATAFKDELSALFKRYTPSGTIEYHKAVELLIATYGTTDDLVTYLAAHCHKLLLNPLVHSLAINNLRQHLVEKYQFLADCDGTESSAIPTLQQKLRAKLEISFTSITQQMVAAEDPFPYSIGLEELAKTFASNHDLHLIRIYHVDELLEQQDIFQTSDYIDRVDREQIATTPDELQLIDSILEKHRNAMPWNRNQYFLQRWGSLESQDLYLIKLIKELIAGNDAIYTQKMVTWLHYHGAPLKQLVKTAQGMQKLNSVFMQAMTTPEWNRNLQLILDAYAPTDASTIASGLATENIKLNLAQSFYTRRIVERIASRGRPLNDWPVPPKKQSQPNPSDILIQDEDARLQPIDDKIELSPEKIRELFSNNPDELNQIKQALIAFLKQDYDIEAAQDARWLCSLFISEPFDEMSGEPKDELLTLWNRKKAQLAISNAQRKTIRDFRLSVLKSQPDNEDKKTPQQFIEEAKTDIDAANDLKDESHIAQTQSMLNALTNEVRNISQDYMALSADYQHELTPIFDQISSANNLDGALESLQQLETTTNQYLYDQYLSAETKWQIKTILNLELFEKTALAINEVTTKQQQTTNGSYETITEFAAIHQDFPELRGYITCAGVNIQHNNAITPMAAYLKALKSPENEQQLTDIRVKAATLLKQFTNIDNYRLCQRNVEGQPSTKEQIEQLHNFLTTAKNLTGLPQLLLEILRINDLSPADNGIMLSIISSPVSVETQKDIAATIKAYSKQTTPKMTATDCCQNIFCHLATNYTAISAQKDQAKLEQCTTIEDIRDYVKSRTSRFELERIKHLSRSLQDRDESSLIVIELTKIAETIVPALLANPNTTIRSRITYDDLCTELDNITNNIFATGRHFGPKDFLDTFNTIDRTKQSILRDKLETATKQNAAVGDAADKLALLKDAHTIIEAYCGARDTLTNIKEDKGTSFELPATTLKCLPGLPADYRHELLTSLEQAQQRPGVQAILNRHLNESTECGEAIESIRSTLTSNGIDEKHNVALNIITILDNVISDIPNQRTISATECRRIFIDLDAEIQQELITKLEQAANKNSQYSDLSATLSQYMALLKTSQTTINHTSKSLNNVVAHSKLYIKLPYSLKQNLLTTIAKSTARAKQLSPYEAYPQLHNLTTELIKAETEHTNATCAKLNNDLEQIIKGVKISCQIAPEDCTLLFYNLNQDRKEQIRQKIVGAKQVANTSNNQDLNNYLDLIWLIIHSIGDTRNDADLLLHHNRVVAEFEEKLNFLFATIIKLNNIETVDQYALKDCIQYLKENYLNHAVLSAINTQIDSIAEPTAIDVRAWLKAQFNGEPNDEDNNDCLDIYNQYADLVARIEQQIISPASDQLSSDELEFLNGESASATAMREQMQTYYIPTLTADRDKTKYYYAYNLIKQFGTESQQQELTAYNNQLIVDAYNQHRNESQYWSRLSAAQQDTIQAYLDRQTIVNALKNNSNVLPNDIISKLAKNGTANQQRAALTILGQQKKTQENIKQQLEQQLQTTTNKKQKTQLNQKLTTTTQNIETINSQSATLSAAKPSTIVFLDELPKTKPPTRPKRTITPATPISFSTASSATPEPLDLVDLDTLDEAASLAASRRISSGSSSSSDKTTQTVRTTITTTLQPSSSDDDNESVQSDSSAATSVSKTSRFTGLTRSVSAALFSPKRGGNKGKAKKDSPPRSEPRSAPISRTPTPLDLLTTSSNGNSKGGSPKLAPSKRKVVTSSADDEFFAAMARANYDGTQMVNINWMETKPAPESEDDTKSKSDTLSQPETTLSEPKNIAAADDIDEQIANDAINPAVNINRFFQPIGGHTESPHEPAESVWGDYYPDNNSSPDSGDAGSENSHHEDFGYMPQSYAESIYPTELLDPNDIREESSLEEGDDGNENEDRPLLN